MLKSESQIEWLIDNGLIDYKSSLDFMEHKVNQIINNQSKDLVWLTQHPPIYTAGISANDVDLLNHDIPVYRTNRGGKYTYHGPGMRIIYVILNLKRIFYPQDPDVAKFVLMLEEAIIKSLGKIGIEGLTRKERVGIWVECKDAKERKIAAIGIKIRKWVSYHGIAVNIDPDLEKFKNIVPCGIKEFGVTSIKDLGIKISIAEFDKIFKKEFTEIFAA